MEANMKYNQLPKSDFSISALSLGCMSLGLDEKNAKQIIETAIDGGITYFDTADLYDFGQNERLVGEFLKPYRTKIHIGTKGGNEPTPDFTSWKWNATKTYLSEAVKQSLKRLQTDYIDLYQLHGGTLEDNAEEIIGLFDDLKKEGYIRSYGISSIRPNVIQKWVNESSLSSVMVEYSLLNRRPEEQIFPLLEQHNIGSLYRGTYAKGQLLKNLSAIDEHPTLRERSKEEICLHFNLNQASSLSCVVGASSSAQLKKSIDAINKPTLSDEEYTYLTTIFGKNVYTDHRI